LARSPELFPLRLLPDGGAQLLRLSEADYSAASFLDERLIGTVVDAGVAGAGDLAAAAAQLPAACDFIFHIGHVGSTLLARLLGASPRVFALREPAVLRQLAWGEGTAGQLGVLTPLLSRVWAPGQRALVKATSFVSELGPALMDASAGARGVLMSVRAEIFVAGMLGGPATRADLPRAAPQRIERLTARLGAPPPRVSSVGEMAAAMFAAEMLTLGATAAGRPDAVLWLDFDAFLLDPRRHLARVMTHLFADASQAELGPLLATPDMGRYAKAPEHPFGAGQRGAILRASAQENQAEIAAAMRWLERLAASHPKAARLLETPGAA
jgi:hypothetical protein